MWIPRVRGLVILFLCAGCESGGEPAHPAKSDGIEPVGTDYTDDLSAPRAPTFSVGEFAGSTTCGVCHPQHVREWSASPHASAMADPVFRELVRLQRADLGKSNDRFCTQCHSAIGSRSGDIAPGFEFESLSSVTLQGVTCESCHRVTAIERDFNAGHVIDPVAPLQGPLAGTTSPHGSERSQLLQSSQFCAGCHDVATPGGLVLERPFAEWTKSPAATAGLECQGCHMPIYAGKASSLPDVPERPDLHRHTFTGVDIPLALLSRGAETDLLATMAMESANLLRSSAELRVEARMDETDRVALKVTVENKISGHRFPTGSSFSRQFWLAIDVTDSTGDHIYASGFVDEHGDLYDAHHPDAAAIDPNLIVLGSYLVDANDGVTLFPWRAVSLRENCIDPQSQAVFEYSFDLPHEVTGPVRVEAALRFRSFSPRLLRTLGLNEMITQLRTTDIAVASTRISGTEAP